MSVDEAAVSRGSLIVYALPLLGLLLGAGAGQTLALQLGVSYPDALALLFGTAGMAAGIAAGRRVSGRTERDQRFEPVLTSRVGGWPLDDSRDR